MPFCTPSAMSLPLQKFPFYLMFSSLLQLLFSSYLLYLCSPNFSFILVLWSLQSPAGSNNKHLTLDFLQATQLKGQDPSPAHKIYNSLTLTSAAPWKTEPCAKTAVACKMYNCLTLMPVEGVNKRGN